MYQAQRERGRPPVRFPCKKKRKRSKKKDQRNSHAIVFLSYPFVIIRSVLGIPPLFAAEISTKLASRISETVSYVTFINFNPSLARSSTQLCPYQLDINSRSHFSCVLFTTFLYSCCCSSFLRPFPAPLPWTDVLYIGFLVYHGSPSCKYPLRYHHHTLPHKTKRAATSLAPPLPSRNISYFKEKIMLPLILSHLSPTLHCITLHETSSSLNSHHHLRRCLHLPSAPGPTQAKACHPQSSSLDLSLMHLAFLPPPVL